MISKIVNSYYRKMQKSDEFEIKHKKTFTKAYKWLNQKNVQFLLPVKAEEGLIKKHNFKSFSSKWNGKVNKVPLHNGLKLQVK
jgi:hypothetical protein